MLNNIGLPGILLIAVVVLVLFGRGKISGLMGEVGKGITSFKKGISEGTKELEEEATVVKAEAAVGCQRCDTYTRQNRNACTLTKIRSRTCLTLAGPNYW